MQAASESVHETAVRGKSLISVGSRSATASVSQAGHHFSQSFCSSGKSSRNHSLVLALALASCVTLEHQSPLWASVSYLQDEELDEVTFKVFQLLNSLVPWRPWVSLTLKPRHHKRSKDEKLSANKGRVTHLKASASKTSRLGGKLIFTMASQNSSLKWAKTIKILLLCQASVNSTSRSGFLFTIDIFVHYH